MPLATKEVAQSAVLDEVAAEVALAKAGLESLMARGPAGAAPDAAPAQAQAQQASKAQQQQAAAAQSDMRAYEAASQQAAVDRDLADSRAQEAVVARRAALQVRRTRLFCAARCMAASACVLARGTGRAWLG